jgi:hypothetical protein
VSRSDSCDITGKRGDEKVSPSTVEGPKTAGFVVREEEEECVAAAHVATFFFLPFSLLFRSDLLVFDMK